VSPEIEHEAQRALHRKLLLGIHAAIAVMLALVYLSGMDLKRFPYWRRGTGLTFFLMALPAWLPYAISAAYSAKVVTYVRLRIAAFVAILLGGAVLQVAVFLHTLVLDDTRSDFSNVVWLVLELTVAYIWAGKFILDVDVD
jgi:hypothetical protein